MPDTGAPWNIPYVASSDLVKDWPTDSQSLADAIADGLDEAALINNLVTTVKTDVFTTTSGTFTDITGLTATITPSTTARKVLIIAQISFGLTNAAAYGHFRLAGGNASDYVGDAASARVRAVFGGYSSSDQTLNLSSASLVYVDSPATTSPVTYSVQTRRGTTGSVVVNRSVTDTNNDSIARGASSLTVIEVAA